MRIEGERISLRPAGREDASHLLAWSLNQEVARLARGEYPTTLEGTHRWLEEGRRDRYRMVFIIEGPNGMPIGDVDLYHIAWRSKEAELRIRIGLPELWNQGLGTEAIRTLLRYLFEERGMRRIYLRVLKSNPRAIRCYEKCGFRKEGRMRVEENGRPDELLLMSVTHRQLLEVDELSAAAAASGRRTISA